MYCIGGQGDRNMNMHGARVVVFLSSSGSTCAALSISHHGARVERGFPRSVFPAIALGGGGKA